MICIGKTKCTSEKGLFLKLPTIMTTTRMMMMMMMMMMTNLPRFTLPCFFLPLSSWYVLAIRVRRNLELPSPCKQMSLGTAKRGSIGTESVSKVFAYQLSGIVPQSTQIQKLKQEGTIVRFSNNTRKMPSTLCFPIVHLKKQECRGCTIHLHYGFILPSVFVTLTVWTAVHEGDV